MAHRVTDAKALMVRLPPDVKDWLMKQAALNLSSQTSEIVRAVRAAMATREAAE